MFYKHLRYVLNMLVKLRSIHILQDSSRMQYIAEEGCADSSLQVGFGAARSLICKSTRCLATWAQSLKLSGEPFVRGKYGVWWKGVQRKGKAGNCKQQGASKQVAGKGEGAEKVVYSHDIGTKNAKNCHDRSN